MIPLCPSVPLAEMASGNLQTGSVQSLVKNTRLPSHLSPPSDFATCPLIMVSGLGRELWFYVRIVTRSSSRSRDKPFPMQISFVIKTCRDRSMGAGLSSQPTAALEPSSKLPQESSKQLSERFASKGFGGVAISVELRSGRETGCQAGRFRWHQIQGRTAALLLSQRCQESYIFKSYLKSSVEQPCRAGRMSALQMIGFEERGCRRRGFKYLLCALGTRPVMLLQARSPIQALEQCRNLSSWEK